jgi:hypothetical protein
MTLAEIDWGALGQAAWTSVAIGLGVLLVAGVAVTSSLRAQDAKAGGHGSGSAVFNVVTIACVVALFAAVVIGIYIMTDK